MAEQGLFPPILLLSALLLTGCVARAPVAPPPGVEPAAALPGVSGLAWVEGDLFLAVHDAKRSKKQKDWPRVSLARLPRKKNEGITWEAVDLEFPGEEGAASDLESACRLPGGRGFLLAESGPRKKVPGRIFHAGFEDGRLKISSGITWPEEVKNVEAIGVCPVGDRLVFLYAERAEGESSTEIRWAVLSLEPLEFGPFRGVTYEGADFGEKDVRLISALAMGGDDTLYAVSTCDPGEDGGPFQSVVWRIGRVGTGKDGKPRVAVGERERVATLDGLKVEALAFRESEKGGRQLFVGTDDEDYGGIIRPLPLDF